MYKHEHLASEPFARSRLLVSLLSSGAVTLGGNSKLHIYGTLTCSSGKRMKIKNRVFFTSEAEALVHLYRPCGHCMREKYLTWKSQKP